ncbi:hypothetical protein SADUNF_Sadunf03G0001700 [Salix dunnii]|uniref:Uncharacterized protein n=1 Tax=Salix dunnii TaxID=1413687 RepID=A0A835KFC9_9ROSI|nr:hypothetical protein SADUNF_Sadunf03G0001700 [Salix dunnii]
MFHGSLIENRTLTLADWAVYDSSHKIWQTDFVSPFFAVLIMDMIIFESCSNDPTYNRKKPE